MAYSKFSVLYILFLGSCMLRSGHELSKFSYNDRTYNSLIVNRRPDYGDGHRDGCIVMEEIHLRIKSLSVDSILFESKDVNTHKPVLTTIEIHTRDGYSSILQTDSSGFAYYKLQSNLQALKAFSEGYRPLIVDLSKFRRI